MPSTIMHVLQPRSVLESGLSSATQKTCLCCLEDFQPSSQVAVLPCGHIFDEDGAGYLCPMTVWGSGGFGTKRHTCLQNMHVFAEKRISKVDRTRSKSTNPWLTSWLHLVAKANQMDSTMIYDVRKPCPSLVHTHAGLHPGMVSCKEESFSDLPHLPFQFHGAVMRCPGDPPGSTDLPPAPVFTALVIHGDTREAV